MHCHLSMLDVFGPSQFYFQTFHPFVNRAYPSARFLARLLCLPDQLVHGLTLPRRSEQRSGEEEKRGGYPAHSDRPPGNLHVAHLSIPYKTWNYPKPNWTEHTAGSASTLIGTYSLAGPTPRLLPLIGTYSLIRPTSRLHRLSETT